MEFRIKDCCRPLPVRWPAGIKRDSFFRLGPDVYAVPGLVFEEASMSRVCQVTGKGPMTGNRVSHANNKRRRRFLPNLHEHSFWVESERRFISLRISTRGLRTIEKNGIDSVVAKLRAKGVAL